MSEEQVRQLLATLADNYANAANKEQVIAFSGGMSALEMVLEGKQ